MDGVYLPGPRPVRDDQGRFVRGNPGRPFGSRNRVSKRVARAILRDFETNQAELLPRLRRWFLPQYVSLVARLMPRLAEAGGAEVDGAADIDDLEAAALVGGVRAALARIDAGAGSLADLEAALLGEHLTADAVTIGDLR
ncbi:MAG TPA: hypothetical protein VGL58_19460 [Caulobacteraceae bacterium]|jgi:hypothetical protein